MVMEASSMLMMNPSSSSSSYIMKKPKCPSILGFGPSLKMGGFWDKGQLEYYKSPMRIRCGGGEKKKVKEEEKMKKKKKKLKGLYKDLPVFYGSRFGLDSEYYQQKLINNDEGVADLVKFKMISVCI